MKRLSQLTTDELKEQLSIAGSPNKLIGMMQDILVIMAKVDQTNAAELINLDLVLRRLQAEVRFWKRQYEDRIGQKIG
jgi:hypothetical protein